MVTMAELYKQQQIEDIHREMLRRIEVETQWWKGVGRVGCDGSSTNKDRGE